MTSRSLYSVKNVFVTWVGQVVSLLCTFVVRMVFVRHLSQDYLGLETLFSNVLSILAFAELGIGSAIVFSLYAPLARHDEEAIKSIMRLFRRAYVTIGIVIAVVGCALAPNIELFINDAPDIPNLKLYFLFFVFNTAISYFFSYKGLLITADQKNYLVAFVRYAFQVGLCVFQIAVLVLTQNYILFLTCMLVSTLGQNIAISEMANRRYPFLKEKDIAPIERETLEGIKKNVFGLVVHKASSAVNSPVNGLIISSALGLVPLAIYGNYILVTNSLSKIVDQMFDSVVSSIGNLNMTSSSDRQYEVFQTAHFVNAFLYGALTVCFLPLVSPFVELAFGGNYLFPLHVAILFGVWFYTKGMRDAVLAFISAHGLYWRTKDKALAETITLILSVSALTTLFGIEGLLVANIFVQVFISLTIEAVKLFKWGLKRSVIPYFRKVTIYTIATSALCILAFFVVSLIPGGALVRFLVGAVVCVFIGFGGFALLFCRTREFSEVRGIVLSLVKSKFSKSHPADREGN